MGWYLVCCKRGKIEQAKTTLSLLGVRTFCPMMRIEKKRKDSGGVRVKIEPMFQPYLFVEFDPLEVNISSVNSSPGVSYFVRYGDEPRALPKALIDALMIQTYTQIAPADAKVQDEKYLELKERLKSLITNENTIKRTYAFLALLDELLNETKH